MICDACRQSTSGRCWAHSASITLPATDHRPPVSGEPSTETGRQLVQWSNDRGYDLYWHVIAIEAEAGAIRAASCEWCGSPITLIDGVWTDEANSGDYCPEGHRLGDSGTSAHRPAIGTVPTPLDAATLSRLWQDEEVVDQDIDCPKVDYDATAEAVLARLSEEPK